MNRYLIVKVRKGQIYQIVWKDAASGEFKRKIVTTPKDKEWMVFEVKF